MGDADRNHSGQRLLSGYLRRTLRSPGGPLRRLSLGEPHRPPDNGEDKGQGKEKAEGRTQADDRQPNTFLDQLRLYWTASPVTHLDGVGDCTPSHLGHTRIPLVGGGYAYPI